MPLTVDAGDTFGRQVRRLNKLKSGQLFSILNKYGPMGVSALSAATPSTTGETAMGWYYEIEQANGIYGIIWKNRHIDDGANVALLINYGHGTGTGGYVPPRPFIKQAMAPIFAQIMLEVRKVVAAA